MFKLKTVKLQSATDSGNDFCNVAAILSFVQNLWFLLDLLYYYHIVFRWFPRLRPSIRCNGLAYR